MLGSGPKMRKMEHRFAEEITLTFEVLKWAVLATIIGIIVGISTTAFLKLLELTIETTRQSSYYFLILPLSLFLNALILYYVFPKADAHTANKVLEYLHKWKKIPLLSIPKVFFLPVLTIGTGGSAGKETPAADVGAGIGSALADLLSFDAVGRRKMMLCGLSAGFAAVFGTPLAGAIFAVEILFAGSILYEAILPSFIAAMVSHFVSSGLGIVYFYNPIKIYSTFDWDFLFYILLGGIFFGACSIIFIEMMKFAKLVSEKLAIWEPEPMKGLIGGGMLVILTFLLASQQYLGLGLETIESSLNGQPTE